MRVSNSALLLLIPLVADSSLALPNPKRSAKSHLRVQQRDEPGYTGILVATESLPIEAYLPASSSGLSGSESRPANAEDVDPSAVHSLLAATASFSSFSYTSMPATTNDSVSSASPASSPAPSSTGSDNVKQQAEKLAKEYAQNMVGAMMPTLTIEMVLEPTQEADGSCDYVVHVGDDGTATASPTFVPSSTSASAPTMSATTTPPANKGATEPDSTDPSAGSPSKGSAPLYGSSCSDAPRSSLSPSDPYSGGPITTPADIGTIPTPKSAPGSSSAPESSTSGTPVDTPVNSGSNESNDDRTNGTTPPVSSMPAIPSVSNPYLQPASFVRPPAGMLSSPTSSISMSMSASPPSSSGAVVSDMPMSSSVPQMSMSASMPMAAFMPASMPIASSMSAEPTDLPGNTAFPSSMIVSIAMSSASMPVSTDTPTSTDAPVSSITPAPSSSVAENENGVATETTTNWTTVNVTMTMSSSMSNYGAMPADLQSGAGPSTTVSLVNAAKPSGSGRASSTDPFPFFPSISASSIVSSTASSISASGTSMPTQSGSEEYEDVWVDEEEIKPDWEILE